MTPLLSVRGLRYDYPDGTPALRGVDFSFGVGEKLALVGSNGSGKSTLLLHLAGCLAPSGGEIIFNGKTVGRDVEKLRGRVGMIFQEPDDQLFMPSVIEDVAFGLRARGESDEKAIELSRAALDTFDIARLAERAPHRISGGEKRMVAICGVLVTNPELVLLDEPSSSLDSASRRRLINALKRTDCPMIIATHDLDLALEICERTIVLGEGKCLAEGPTQKLLYDENLMKLAGLSE